MNLFLDSEAIPSQVPSVLEAIKAEAEEEKANLSAPKNYSKPETIEAWLVEKRAEIDAQLQRRYEECSLEGATNHIICISAAFDDEELVSFAGLGIDPVGDEREVIEGFFRAVSGARITSVVGHTILNFDLKVIRQRAIILGIQPPSNLPFFAKPWENSVYDIMTKWDPIKKVSLDKICKALGIPGKGVISGKDVYPLFKEGRMVDIINYCEDDVRKAREVWKRMTFNGAFV